MHYGSFTFLSINALMTEFMNDRDEINITLNKIAWQIRKCKVQNRETFK